jgi:hypothetical protein
LTLRWALHSGLLTNLWAASFLHLIRFLREVHLAINEWELIFSFVTKKITSLLIIIVVNKYRERQRSLEHRVSQRHAVVHNPLSPKSPHVRLRKSSPSRSRALLVCPPLVLRSH